MQRFPWSTGTCVLLSWGNPQHLLWVNTDVHQLNSWGKSAITCEGDPNLAGATTTESAP